MVDPSSNFLQRFFIKKIFCTHKVDLFFFVYYSCMGGVQREVSEHQDSRVSRAAGPYKWTLVNDKIDPLSSAANFKRIVDLPTDFASTGRGSYIERYGNSMDHIVRNRRGLKGADLVECFEKTGML